MHPFRTDDIFLRNAWYVGCAAEELSDGPLERVILGQPVVFYRSESGRAMAMHGICPHRAYPLALHGKISGDAIICHYHGFAFDGRSGACVSVPTQSTSPTGFRQRVYKVVESGPWIWIWTGDPELADESNIPDPEEIGLGSNWTYIRPTKFVDVKARYMLLVENLMDLTHLAFLHGDLGDFSKLISSPMEIRDESGRFQVIRSMRGGWSPEHDILFGPQHRFSGLSDFSSITTYFSVGYITTSSHIIKSIDGFDHVDKRIYGDVYFHHAVTPATRHSCHYYGTTSRTHRPDDGPFDEMFFALDSKARAQDVEAVEAIEARMMQFGEPSTELLVRSDAAAGRIRRKIQREIDDELTGITPNKVRVLDSNEPLM